MLYYFVITIIAHVLDLDAFQALGLASIISLTFLMLFVPIFANTYYRYPNAGSVTLVTLLCGWGIGWK